MAVGACSPRVSGPVSPARAAREQPRIAIVGAGLAGLHCAYRLQQAGVTSTVFEASKRVGGRVFTTKRGTFPDGQVGELGGELIDSSHLTMHALARELEITLDDRLAFSQSAGDVFWLGGRRVPLDVIAAQFVQAAPRITEAARHASSHADAMTHYDNLSLHSWIRAELHDLPELAMVLETAYRGEFGLEPDEQSSLNLLWLLGRAESEEQRLFGDSDERFRAHLGSQVFADRLAARLARPVVRDRELVRVRGDAARGYQLTFQDDHGASYEARADRVILSIPFSVLRRVDLREVPLTELKRTILHGLGYGTHSKVLSSFQRPNWRRQYGESGGVLSDLPVQQLWDTSLGQGGESGLLTNFLGGKPGELAGSMEAERWMNEHVLPHTELIWPGNRPLYRAHSAVRMHWPGHAFTRGGYACYRPGQWAWSGSIGLPEADGTLLFCGEHTSVDHQGFMEGAAETGALVADALLAQLDRTPVPEHAALVRIKRGLAQPAYAEFVAPEHWPSRELELERFLTSFL